VAVAIRLSRPRAAEARRTFPALGTFATVIVETPPDLDPEAMISGADSLLRRIEAETGRFPGQGVWEINMARGAALSELGPHMLGVIALSDSVFRSTGGLFDPTAGALVDAWGFPDHPHFPEEAELKRALGATGWQLLEFRNDSILIPEGMKLDFGAVAKGYAVDRAYEYLVSRGARSCLVEVGGEVRCGGERLWRVAVRHPRNSGYYAVYEVRSGALATSGDYECFLIHDGVRYSHLIDPFTGFSGTGAQSATVLAETCGRADAYATAAAVGGEEAVRGFDMSGVLGILLLKEDESGEVLPWSTGVLPNSR
jgi:thiamine biosynthesis lipoprotein